MAGNRSRFRLARRVRALPPRIIDASRCQVTMPFSAAEKAAMKKKAKGGGGGGGPDVIKCCFPGWLKGCVVVSCPSALPAR